MGYLGFGQFGYNSNPFLNGLNPFANYSNPYLYNNFGSSLLQQPLINFGAYGYFPSYSNYNFLNSPSISAQPATNFGNYTPLFNNFGSSNLSGFGSFGNFGNYNFLGSSLSAPTIPSFNTLKFQQPATNQYTFTNWANYQNNTQTQTLDNSQSKQTTVKEKTISNGQGYGPEFLTKVKKIANNLNCNYKDLLAVMNAESGIKTTAVNKSTNATGLIQFMPKTAQGLGTTVEQLKKMTPVKQLDYVEKYLQQTKRQAGFSADKKLSGGELYALVFRPARAKTGIFATKEEAAYKLNEGLDLNKDGKVTMDELSKRVQNFYVSDNSFLA